MKRKSIPSDVRLYYVKDVQITELDEDHTLYKFSSPVACVAAHKVAGGRVYRFALSVLNPLDNEKVNKFGFKKEARSIAISRVLTVPTTPREPKEPGDKPGMSLPDVGGFIDATEGFSKKKLLESIIANKRLPSRVRKAARHTLRYFAHVQKTNIAVTFDSCGCECDGESCGQ